MTDWALILVIWGDAYRDQDVNILANAVKQQSPSCREVVIVTDRPRPGLSPWIVQKPFPTFFSDPEFFLHGYPAKLSFFHRDIAPENLACIYIDLDSVVLGDLGSLAKELRSPDDMMMLPPGNVIGFGGLRRWFAKKSDGQRFPIGNSSVVVFHSAGRENICDIYEARYLAQGGAEQAFALRALRVDDVFISWSARDRIRGVPKRSAVSFRREFLSRSVILLQLKALLPWVRARRAGLLIVTFNGAEHKPKQFAAMPIGTALRDRKGRRGIWRQSLFAPIFDRLRDTARRLSAPEDQQ